jgi:hypothetical protein
MNHMVSPVEAWKDASMIDGVGPVNPKVESRQWTSEILRAWFLYPLTSSDWSTAIVRRQSTNLLSMLIQNK